MKTRVPIRSLALAAWPLLSLGAPTISQAQVWQVSNVGLHLEGTGFADIETTGLIPFGVWGTFTDSRSSVIANFAGSSYGNRWYSFCEDNWLTPPPPKVRSQCEGQGEAYVYGDLTQRLTMRWFARADGELNGLDDYFLDTESLIGIPGVVNSGFVVQLTTLGAPPGFPLTVFYSWSMRSAGESVPEGLPPFGAPPEPDFSRVSNTRLEFDGVDQLQGRFDFAIDDSVVRSIDYSLRDQSGSFVIPAGNTLTILVSGKCETRIRQMDSGVLPHEDNVWATIRGELRLFLDVPPPPSPPPGLPGLPPAFLDFSLDIGSDTELSDDPIRGAERVFDPGDVYMWAGPPLPNPGGQDGYRDDANIWHGFVDPFPSPPDLFSAAPVCSGVLPPPSNYFDLDGHDALNVDLSLFIPEFMPLPSPIQGSLPLMTPSTCIWPAEYLLISFEDDQQFAYPSCDVPPVAFSPSGMTHGGAPPGPLDGFDEVMGLVVSSHVPSGPYLLYPLAVEQTVHISMLPDPAPGHEEWDDDVDSLDASPVLGGCTIALFGADHEANYHLDPQNGNFTPLDPGAVYQISGPGLPPRKLVDPVIHLGLPPGVDLADFEFVWINDDSQPFAPAVLSLIFAVHRDDPSTGQDESGTLDPQIIYCSFLTGWSQPFLPGQLPDDVDAITAFDRDLSTPDPPPMPGWCPGDGNHDHLVSFADITAALANWGQLYPPGAMGFGDANCNGVVNFQDITIVLSNWGQPCP